MGRGPAGHRLTTATLPPAPRHRRSAAAVATAALLAITSCAAQPTSTATEPGLAAVPATAGTLLAPVGLAPATRQAWLDRLDRTAQALADAGLEPLDDGWDGRLLIELPPTAEWYARLAGSGTTGAAAVTRCPAEGARITVNPVVGDEDADYLDSLILHEGVHLATGSSCAGEAAQWVEEGLAEWLACQHSAACLDASRQWVAHYLDEHGVPTALPADSEFSGPSAQVSAAYALARQAVASAVDRLGVPATMALLDTHYRAAADAEATRRLTGWYLADLQRLSGSAQR